MDDPLPGLAGRVAAAMCLVVLSDATPARAGASQWVEAEGGRVRLVTKGAPEADGRLRGALQIDLQPGWKTYWRDPGDAGVPPTLDVVGTNASVEAIDFPAPVRHHDGDYSWAGYERPVALPVTFHVDAAETSGTIEASAFLGICETICVPVKADLVVAINGDATHDGDVDAAFAALPAPADAHFGVTPLETAGDTTVLKVTAPAGATVTDLFLAGSDGYVFATPERSERDGSTVFTVQVARPDTKPSGPGLRYTLVTSAGSVEGLLPYL
jgi:DsbC/DsbD-like thiol-disulfide interchange protein